MNLLIISSLLFCFNLKAEVSRSPAVVEESCESEVSLQTVTRKLADVECKKKISSALSQVKAPAIKSDSSFNGKRISKSADPVKNLTPAKEELKAIGK